MRKTATVYWLLPAKPERDLFCSVIRILRKGFKAPNFEPHLTLFVTSKDGESPKRVLQQLRTRPIRLAARGVAFSPKFTKTLYIRFKSSPTFRKLVGELGRATKSRAKPPADPHVSLLYKNIPRTTKKSLAAVLQLPLRNVVFDSIVAVRITLPVRTRADVDKWKIVAKKKLSG
ncbi:MAG TPA: 2'-5' RNA ligase family protein [Chthoniobacterales bacterium]|nr:2'-5' RNA ligase family protein [Chthoniobacterales bacterium]